MRKSVLHSYLIARLKMHYPTNTTGHKLTVPEIMSLKEHL